jgi:hypothetical protein
MTNNSAGGAECGYFNGERAGSNPAMSLATRDAKPQSNIPWRLTEKRIPPLHCGMTKKKEVRDAIEYFEAESPGAAAHP